MVFIVLMVSTLVCGTNSMGSNPINHPKYPYGGIGIRSGFRHHTIEGSNPSMGTEKNIHKGLILWKTFLIFVMFFEIIDNTLGWTRG